MELLGRHPRAKFNVASADRARFRTTDAPGLWVGFEDFVQARASKDDRCRK